MTTFATGDRVRVVGGTGAVGEVIFARERECRVDWYGSGDRTADSAVLEHVPSDEDRNGKRRWATHLPWLALGLVVDAFEAGLKDGRKPGDWKAAVRAPGGREMCRDALMRHAIGACDPEGSGLDDGPDGTGKLHLALAGARVLMLLWDQLQDGGE